MLLQERALAKRKIPTKKIGYKYGVSGDVLLYAFLYKTTLKDVYYQKVVTQLEEILYLFSHDLFEGRRYEEAADLGRVLFLLETIEFIDGADFETVQKKISTILREELQKLLQGDSFHICSGLLAIGYYFIESKYQYQFKKEIEEIIHWIDRKAQTSGADGRFWTTHFLNNRIYLGNVHGILSIVRFLIKCKEEGFSDTTCEKNIRYGINFVLRQQSKELKGLLSFPEHIGAPSTELPLLQWNYGSFNILFSLVNYASQYISPDVYSNIIESLLSISGKEAGKYTCESNSIAYGTAGIALVYNKLYRTTGLPMFKNIAALWRDETYHSVLEQKNDFDLGFFAGYCGTLTSLLLLDNDETYYFDNLLYL